jgi:hypothetical protein
LDLLVDILLELPGVLGAIETLKESALPRYILLQKAFELAYWTRRLIQDLELWKSLHIWTHSAISTTSTVKNLELLELCEVATSQVPYDANLAEALNCYCAAHLILAQIALGLADRSLVFAAVVRAPYTLRELIDAIVLVSKRHVVANTVDMISMMVTAFPLNVAANGMVMTNMDDPPLLETLRGLIDQVNESFARRFNIASPVSHGLFGRISRGLNGTG